MGVSSTFPASDGDAYELQMGRWSRQLAEPFLDFAGAKDGESVLDVGCGTGSLTLALAKRCRAGSIAALDYSPDYVEFARRRIRDARIEFRVGDACALPYPDAVFDRVFSLLMLHFVPQAERAIAEMARVARTGAVVAAAVWDARGGFVANRIFWDTAALLGPAAREQRARNYTRPMTRRDELARAWRATGLRDVAQAALTIRMEFSSFDDYWSPYLGAQGPGAAFVGSLSGEERERLRDMVRLAYLGGEPDGDRSFAASAWVVKGIKA